MLTLTRLASQELDKKKKKKKGTLGVGNGAVFFASETDKVRRRVEPRGSLWRALRNPHFDRWGKALTIFSYMVPP